MSKRIKPAVGSGVGALSRRANQGGGRRERAEPIQWLSRRGLVHVPRAVDLWLPAAIDEFVGDVGQRGVLDHGRGVQYAAHWKTRLRRHRYQPVRRGGVANVTALDLNVCPGSANPLDRLLRLRIGRRPGVEHYPSAARRGHLGGEEQPEPAQAAGDDVGTVGPEHASLRRRHHRHAAPMLRNVEHHLAGVPGTADQTDGGGRIAESGSACSRGIGSEPSAVSSYTVFSSS